MAEHTAIEWCDATFNPWIGCTKVGPGCDHCYAEARMDTRHHRAKWGAGQPRVRTAPANWKLPIRWNDQPFMECPTCRWRGDWRECVWDNEQCPECGGIVELARRRVFCASLADVFDNEVDTEWRMDLFKLIAETPNLDWLLLTKRIGNVKSLLPAGFRPTDFQHVSMGATFCNQAEWDRDADKLFATPFGVHFGSFEPLLGEIDMTQCPQCGGGGETSGHYFSADGLAICERCHGQGSVKYLDLGWCIAGGESGYHARPMHPNWVRSLRDQCAAASVPFLFKQWGEWAPVDVAPGIYRALDPADQAFQKIGKKAAGRLLDGVEHNGFPERG